VLYMMTKFSDTRVIGVVRKNIFSYIVCLKLILSSCRINPLNPELNPICELLALLAHHFLNVSRLRVNKLSDIYVCSLKYITA
jgi:hypothetical protein